MLPLPQPKHVLSLGALLVGERVWSALRPGSSGHGPTS